MKVLVLVWNTKGGQSLDHANAQFPSLKPCPYLQLWEGLNFSQQSPTSDNTDTHLGNILQTALPGFDLLCVKKQAEAAKHTETVVW